MQCSDNWVNNTDFSQYDLHDYMFDASIPFDKIIDAVIEAHNGYGFDRNRVWSYEIEIAAITAAQWDAVGGYSTQAKTNRYDYEIQKIKNDLIWAGIQSSDTVEVIFWQDNYGPLVSFARKTKRPTVMKLLDVQYNEMREAGWSYDFIAKTVTALREWAEKLLTPDEKEFEQEQIESVLDDESEDSADIAFNLFSMFYAENDDDVDGGGYNGQ